MFDQKRCIEMWIINIIKWDAHKLLGQFYYSRKVNHGTTYDSQTYILVCSEHKIKLN